MKKGEENDNTQIMAKQHDGAEGRSGRVGGRGSEGVRAFFEPRPSAGDGGDQASSDCARRLPGDHAADGLCRLRDGAARNKSKSCEIQLQCSVREMTAEELYHFQRVLHYAISPKLDLALVLDLDRYWEFEEK